MKLNVHTIVLYCLFALLFLAMGFVLYKLFSTNSKLKRVLSFLNGEVFSDQFQQVLRTYFSNNDNITPIIDQLFPTFLAFTVPNQHVIPGTTTPSPSSPERNRDALSTDGEKENYEQETPQESRSRAKKTSEKTPDL